MPSGVSRPWYKRSLLITALVIGVLFLVFAGIIIYQTVVYYQVLKSGQDPLKNARQENFRVALNKLFMSAVVTDADRRLLDGGDNPAFGNPKAKVKIVLFVDWDCAYSKNTAPSIRSLTENHADDIYLTIRDFPITDLHPRAEKAALAARCVFKQDEVARYWRFYDLLFQTQGNRTDDDLRRFASQIGVDQGKFDKCFSSNDELAVIKSSVQDGVALGVTGTPTFFFNGVKIQGDMDLASLEMVIDEAAKSANK